ERLPPFLGLANPEVRASKSDYRFGMHPIRRRVHSHRQHRRRSLRRHLPRQIPESIIRVRRPPLRPRRLRMHQPLQCVVLIRHLLARHPVLRLHHLPIVLVRRPCFRHTAVPQRLPLSDRSVHHILHPVGSSKGEFERLSTSVSDPVLSHCRQVIRDLCRRP